MFIAASAYFYDLLPIVWNSFGIGKAGKTNDCRKGLNPLNLGVLGSPCSRSFRLLIDDLRCFAASLEICLLFSIAVHSNALALS